MNKVEVKGGTGDFEFELEKEKEDSLLVKMFFQ
jgi:hypothetical protein